MARSRKNRALREGSGWALPTNHICAPPLMFHGSILRLARTPRRTRSRADTKRNLCFIRALRHRSTCKCVSTSFSHEIAIDARPLPTPLPDDVPPLCRVRHLAVHERRPQCLVQSQRLLPAEPVLRSVGRARRGSGVLRVVRAVPGASARS